MVKRVLADEHDRKTGDGSAGEVAQSSFDGRSRREHDLHPRQLSVADLCFPRPLPETGRSDAHRPHTGCDSGSVEAAFVVDGEALRRREICTTSVGEADLIRVPPCA